MKPCIALNKRVEIASLSRFALFIGMAIKAAYHTFVQKQDDEIEQDSTIYTLEGFIDIPDSDLPAVLEALPEHIKLTLAEPGCIRFAVTPFEDSRNRYRVSEQFTCEAAFLQHQARIIDTNWASVTKNVARHYEINDDGATNRFDVET